MTTARRWLKDIQAWALRLIAIGAGVYIEYRQVFVKADLTLVVLGLWLMSVPPALWLDTLRRGMRATESIRNSQPDPELGPDASSVRKRRSDED